MSNNDYKNVEEFLSFFQWVAKNHSKQMLAYTCTALVTYETNSDEYSFYNKKTTVQISTDSQKVGSIFLPELDETEYFTEFIAIWQSFTFDAQKKELIITSKNSTSIKKFNTYKIKIFGFSF